MRKLLSVILLAASCLALRADTTNLLGGPFIDGLTAATNIYTATYGIYDTTSKKAGVGVALGYKLSDFVLPVIRLDIINNGVWVPSGSLQLQAPITFNGKITIVPFGFTGIATSIATYTSSQNATVIGIFGAGGALRINSTKWYVPSDILVDYERWTGGPFNDNQIRAGLAFHFWKS